jgi:hypothetical protein
MRADKPSHPVQALTTYEPHRHRRALEHSLKAIPLAPRSASCCTRGSPKY